jgi:hypothetical protein
MFYRDLRNFSQSVYLLYYLRSEETYSGYKFPNPSGKRLEYVANWFRWFEKHKNSKLSGADAPCHFPSPNKAEKNQRELLEVDRSREYQALKTHRDRLGTWVGPGQRSYEIYVAAGNNS